MKSIFEFPAKPLETPSFFNFGKLVFYHCDYKVTVPSINKISSDLYILNILQSVDEENTKCDFYRYSIFFRIRNSYGNYSFYVANTYSSMDYNSFCVLASKSYNSTDVYYNLQHALYQASKLCDSNFVYCKKISRKRYYEYRYRFYFDV